MPFSLCNALQTLCSLMHKVIFHNLHEKVSVYLDDLLVTSNIFEEQILKEIKQHLSYYEVCKTFKPYNSMGCSHL